MSDELKILESCDHSGRYTVKELHGCRMVFGDVPISEFKSLWQCQEFRVSEVTVKFHGILKLNP